MPEFEDAREDLNKTRADRDEAAQQAAVAREQNKRAARKQSQFERSADPQNPADIEKLNELKQQATEAAADFTGKQEKLNELRADAKIKLGQFEAFTDPTKAIENFKDQTPILLMPVRLETRFKRVKPVGSIESTQLWVRIYPDDCWIDTFDPTLTESELLNGKLYWVGIWKAGGFEDQQRAAWADLVNSHGSGRAAWIIANYAPINSGAIPTKALATDIVLVIATENPPTAIEEPAVLNFWRDTWLADGDTTQTLPALETIVGADRAKEIVEQYQPANFGELPQIGFTKDDVNVTVAIAVFPTVETKQQAWSAAPRIDILPERFVFIGYEGKKATVVKVGNQIPSPLIAGPDPTAPESEQLKHDAQGKVSIPEEMKWMTDFDCAIEVGMGMKIDLNASQTINGFDRVLVVGIRVGSNEERGRTELENLLRHHSHTRKGFAVVPQGTPTNNTEAVGSGLGRLDEPDESFDDLKDALITPEIDWLAKSDGQWIAEYLGVDPMLFSNVHEADSTDQLTQRAMNIALWPATFGYWMEGIMAPVFTPVGIEHTRDFFNRYVVGSGAIPAIRIGTQPYGILPATSISKMDWLTAADDNHMGVHLPSTPFHRFLRQLYAILISVHSDWAANMGDVSFVGKEDDPHKLLLDIVGLHPGSVEWSQRYAESLKTVFNRLNLKGFGGKIQSLLLALQYSAARQLLIKFGHPVSPRATPPILEKIFLGKHYELKGGVIDDQPLSDTALIRTYTETDQNYIQWLIDAAKTSLDDLYQQDGFKDDKPPLSLLYILLRHALQLGYDDTGIRVREAAGILDAAAAARARVDNPFLHITEMAMANESRYQALFAVEPAVSGNLPLHKFIAAQLQIPAFASYLKDQLAALEKLKMQTTGRLERAFANHLDCCSYRLDAWLLGIVNYQLQMMREIPSKQGGPVRRGIYLGGYAWLEDLRPENKIFTSVNLEDPDLIAKFGDPAEPPLMRDATNEGYVHAPSLNHAVAAAVLRNGFISNASDENRKTMAVNLTSERVRTAVGLLEGIRAGQGLADLLGYQFERGLHDRHNLAEVDQFIFKLRKAFPLRADHLDNTKTPEGVPIETIEARNVIDGLALLEQMKTPGNDKYPFGKTTLPDVSELTAQQLSAINLEANRLVEAHDAVADLALSEGVYQAVLGNYDRVASTYDAYARGNFPPEPDIIRTPMNGIGITHRVALHLNPDAVAPAQPTPRSLATPEINEWLDEVLPPPGSVGCVVSFRRALTGADEQEEVTLDQLGLKHVDLVALIRDGNIQTMSELDDRIVSQAIDTMGPRPDHPITIEYRKTENAPFPVFELIPLVRNVRRLITRSRPLKSTDLTLANEATSAQDSDPIFDAQRLQDVVGQMEPLRDDVLGLQSDLEQLLADLTLNQDDIVAQVDQHVDKLVALLKRAATFGVAQAGWGFAYDFRRRVFAAILGQAADLVTRWQVKLDEFNARLNDEALLPLTATDEERFNLLLQAESAISTTPTSPLPVVPADLRNDLINIKLVDFNAKRQQFIDVQDTSATTLTALLTHVETVFLPVTDFDSVAYTLSGHEDEIVHFTEDAVSVLKVIAAELNRRLTESDPLLNPPTPPAAAEKVRLLEQAAQILLGRDCRIFPQFPLGSTQGAEFENALNLSRSGVLFQHLTNPPDPDSAEDFPVDTWLYGVARVREKMHAFEQVIMFAGSLGQPEPELEALQLPFLANDRWLGLEFPSTQPLDQDRLLYTAAHLAGVFDKTKAQCGMLLDEWSEIIPGTKVDTGIAMHYDRPNCEAPQAMLLAMPSKFTGHWEWDDLVNTLNETLDFAKRRAIEPRQIDRTAYGPFLPATIMASQVHQLTIAANLAINNRVGKAMK